MMHNAIAFVCFAVILLVATVAGAQEAAKPELAGDAWQVFGSVYGVLGAMVVALLGWLVAKLNKWIKAKHENEWWAGAIIRFDTALMDALKGRHATLKLSLDKARQVDSPGGAKITREELEQIKQEVWSDLKAQYGGAEGLKKGLGLLAGDDVERWVKNKISGAVGDLERVDQGKPLP